MAQRYHILDNGHHPHDNVAHQAPWQMDEGDPGATQELAAALAAGAWEETGFESKSTKKQKDFM